ncbi:helix-turn-helix domain-containing protein [Nocardiopsis sp. EMB25]|uniref:helix-turn-helix domain-containing protein n=1 Tax=Nocardiopsis sp. EMB25 TaxID=2835867 RepID=UPI002284760D|nr:helix-turn-helix transcriptional regulator [Nocardiopsis sp. EMB25]MCY9784141.1 helix-turn-helix domain-containing protein [Nocardiopsis sp. EMB25]
MSAHENDSKRLGQALKRARLTAGFTGVEAARRAGMSQPKISRLENAVQTPGLDDLDTLCSIYGLSPGERDELQALTESLHRTVESSRSIRKGGGSHLKQLQIGRVEADTSVLRYFQPSTVPGLLQTAEFTRRIYGFTLEGEKLVAAMRALQQRQNVLYDQDKSFTFILTEQALRWRLAPNPVMAAQLHHIASLSTLSNVTVGIIPWSAEVEEAPLHGFEIFDDRLVTVGLKTATISFTEPTDIKRYVDLFDSWKQSAALNDDAREHLSRIARDYDS